MPHVPHAAITAAETVMEGVDKSLSVLLTVQLLTLFAAIPLGALYPSSHYLLDACHIVFALVCVTALTGHRVVQGALLVGLAVLAGGRLVDGLAAAVLGLSAGALRELAGVVAFSFNGLITALVARHVFGPGRVTAHRVQGGVLLYLNVSALFAIAYGMLETHLPGAIAPAAGGALSSAPGPREAALAYFSLATITTTGYGDLVPVHPIARSMANFEAVFGQIFTATLLARLIALQLAHQTGGAQGGDRRP